MTRPVTVEAVPILFSSPDRPEDRVAAFVVTVEHGGTVSTDRDRAQGHYDSARSDRASDHRRAHAADPIPDGDMVGFGRHRRQPVARDRWHHPLPRQDSPELTRRR